MKELIKITNSNAAGNWSFTEFFPCMPMTWQAGYGHRDTQHSIWQEAKTQSILKGKTRNEIGDASASCYQVLPPTLSSPAYITITNKYAWARHHIQNHGSLLSTLQAPNHWFLYPITLQKRKYYLATTAEDPQTHPAEMHWEYQWKELSPSKNFYLLFLPGSLFLSENFASCYRMLWVGHSHFSPTPCQNIQEIKPTSIPCLQKRETCTNSYHKLGSQPHYKSHIPPACILSNHESFLHWSPKILVFWPGSISSVWPSSAMNNRERSKSSF